MNAGHRGSTAAGAVTLLALLMLAAARGASGEAPLLARLAGDQEVPAVATAARGTASLTLSSAGVQFFITVEGLSGPVGQIHIHRGARGVSGPIVRDLTGTLTGGNTVRGLWTASDPEPLTPALIADLLSGNLYINVHTSAHAGGEIRGQIELGGGTCFGATLTGDQENPPVAAAARATGTFTLTEEGLAFQITASGLSGAITGAQLHSGGIGVNGPIGIDLTPFFSGTTASGVVTLTPAQRKSLVGGSVYANIYTAANPGGEIRGQLVLTGGFGLTAHLTGGAEVPPAASGATGNASLTLTPAGLLMDLTATGLSGAITAAQFHDAPAGTDGAVVRTLTPDFAAGTTTAQALWRADDPEPLTGSLIAELLAGNLYIDIHTRSFPGGEIRGQVTLDHPGATPTTSLTARLAGDQEQPPLAVSAKGTASFRLTPRGLAYDVTVDGLTGPIKAANFRSGPIGVSGGVVRDITTSFSGNTATGVWTPAGAQPLTAALVTQLLEGNLYLNVHTGAHPGGEIRGQILPASGAGLTARITGKQETPSSAATGLGAGWFTLTPAGLAFAITVDGLTGAITGAHFHRAAPGVSGGIVHDITGEFSGNTALGVWKPAGAQPLTPALVTELLEGNIHVSVNTAANPGGEIRGQVELASGEGQGASLLGGAEVPPVSTLGAGTLALTLTDEGVVFRLSANDLAGSLAAAHFHNAPFGANGTIEREITPGFTNLTADGVWKPSDGSALTPALIAAMLKDEIYLNVHTGAFPGGEIRGQTRARSVASVDPPSGESSSLGLVNLPNPFDDATEFSFWLPVEGWIDLSVYDLAGRKVATVTHGGYSPGLHRERFDARRLRTGLYLYKLEAGPYRQTGKMLIVR